MKKNNYLLYIIFLVFVIGGVVCYMLFVDDGEPNVNETTKDAYKFYTEYPDVTANNVFMYKTEEEIIEILEKKSGIVYFGFPECKWCQAYVVHLNEVAKENGIKEIYYLNIREIRENKTDNYLRIVELMQNYLPFDENGDKKIYVPQVAFVNEGKIWAADSETSTISEGTPAEYWTDAKIESLKNKLTNYIDLAKLNICTECN